MTKAASSAQLTIQPHVFFKTTFIFQCVPEVFNIAENIKTNRNSQGSNFIFTALSRTLSELFFFFFFF